MKLGLRIPMLKERETEREREIGRERETEIERERRGR